MNELTDLPTKGDFNKEKNMSEHEALMKRVLVACHFRNMAPRVVTKLIGWKHEDEFIDKSLVDFANWIGVDNRWLEGGDGTYAPPWLSEALESQNPTWRNIIHDKWIELIVSGNKKSDDKLQNLISEKTADGKEWGSFSRARTFYDIEKTLTPAQQHAFAIFYGIPVPAFADLQGHACSSANNPSYDLISDEGINLDLLKIGGSGLNMTTTAFWPCERPLNKSAYARDMSALRKCKKSRLVDDSVSVGGYTYDVIYAMRNVFDHHYPDDLEMTLVDAVKCHRQFLKDTKENPMDYKHLILPHEDPADYCMQFLTPGKIYRRDTIEEKLRYVPVIIDRFLRASVEDGTIKRITPDERYWLVYHDSERLCNLTYS